jgi:murein tripeptide amidase MpaA
VYWASQTIDEFIKVLADLFDFVERFPLAKSVEQRPITAFRLRVGPATKRDGVLFVGGLHAREMVPPDLLCRFAQNLIEHYGSDWWIGQRRWPATTIKLILESLDIYFLPNPNPDGREYVLSGKKKWRKNRRVVYQSSSAKIYGVDLNRNFDFLWGIETVDDDGAEATSSTMYADTYFGPKAFSEPETRNLRTLFQTFPITCLVDVHSYGEFILHPWGHAPNQTSDSSQQFTKVDTSDWEELPTDAPNYREFMPARDYLKLGVMGLKAAEAINATRLKIGLTPVHRKPNYTVGQPPDYLYPATGDAMDWAFAQHVVDPSRPPCGPWRSRWAQPT